MKSVAGVSFSRLGCALLLAAFAFAVTADPITDAVAPHDDCAICAMVAHQMVPGEPAPVLSYVLTVTAAAVEDASPPVPCVEHPVNLNRGPPTT